MSFEELRAIKRGWMYKDWRKQKEPLQQISGNAAGSEAFPVTSHPLEDLPGHLAQNLTIDSHSQIQTQDGSHEDRSSKSNRIKVKGETVQTQTGEWIKPLALMITPS
jgi:checkpoint serine/threonine-protein kinase